MAKVLGVGGVFLMSADAPALKAWYGRVLGLDLGDWGVFLPSEALAAKPGSGGVFSLHAEGDHGHDSTAHGFIFNLVVDDLEGMLARAAEAGVTPYEQLDESYGAFARFEDPEGRRFELWEPRVPATE